jgi:hypothetical protein
MKDTDVIAELDNLKLRIMLEGIERPLTEVERFDAWVDEVVGNNIPNNVTVCFPRTYATCTELVDRVSDLYHQKHRDEKEYHKNMRETMTIIREAVHMAVYFVEMTKKGNR